MAWDSMIKSLFEFSGCDNTTYQSPSLSTTTSKTPFSKLTTTANSVISANQLMSGPSHQDDLYKQQTRIVPSALLSAVVVDQNSPQITGYINCTLDYPALGNSDVRFDPNNTPPQLSSNSVNMGMEFISPKSSSPESTVSADSIGEQKPSSISSTPVLSRHVGHSKRPGLRQQAALPKDQAQQRQQQQGTEQQQEKQQRQAAQNQQKPQQRAARDPLLEQTITQLLNSMRAKPATVEGPRSRKNYEEMNTHEKIAREDRKLRSKERRQLRNKVSARAFRSRRKEYILQMESEVANKVIDNGALRTENRALIEENRRLTDLTRMLLSSPSFPDFLDRLDSNPSQLPQCQPDPQPEEQEARESMQ